jgi:lysophospholipase L1-like esterase
MRLRLLAALPVVATAILVPTGRQATADLPAADYVLSARHSGHALDVFNGNTGAGERAIQWSYHGDTNQEWRAAVQSDGTYELKALHSGLLLSVAADGVSVVQAQDADLSTQRWRIATDPVRGSRIASVASDKVLSVADASMTEGAQVVVATDQNVPSQRWYADYVAPVMPLGDSITYGSGASTAVSYRSSLWKHFMDTRGFRPDFVGSVLWGSVPDRANEGHPGFRIDQVRAEIDNWLTLNRPRYVLVHLGTNDINQNYDLPNAPTRLRDLVQRITEQVPGVTVLVASIVPSRDGVLNQRITTYNAAVPGVVDAVRATGADVRFVDLNARMTLADISADNIHPTDAGYLKMGDIWYDALSPLV